MYFLVDDQVRYQTVFENHKMFMELCGMKHLILRVTLIISILNMYVKYMVVDLLSFCFMS